MQYRIASFAPVSFCSSKELGLRTCKTQNSVLILNILAWYNYIICTSEYVIPYEVVLHYLSTHTCDGLQHPVATYVHRHTCL